MAEDAARRSPVEREGDVLQAIGHTSIVELRKVVPENGARILAKLEWENPTGQPQGPDGPGRDLPGGGGRPAEARRHGRRVHRRQHRDVARVRVRRQGVPDPDRQLRCVQPGEARPHGRTGRGADARAQRGRPHHEAADPRHDRGRPRAEPEAEHATGPTSSTTRTASPATTRSGRRSGARRTGRSTPSCTASARRRRCAGSARCSSDTSRASGSSPSSPRSPRCCWAASRGPTRSRESGSATRLRSGTRRSSTRSWRSARPTRRRWRGGWRARKRSSRARLPGPTSSPRSRWPSGWARGRTVVTLMADSGLKYLSTDVYRTSSGGS